MKRSKAINLVLLGSCVLALAGCDEKKDHHAMGFKDEQECQKVHTVEECKKALEEGKRQYAQSAPKFISKEECEKQYGASKCVEAPGAHHEGGHSMFMPMMMGFMMGRMMGGGQPAYVMPPSNNYGAQQAAPARRGGFGSSSSQYSSVGS